MAEPFIGEIKIVGFNFAPKGWAQCNGSLLPISQNQALFAVLGTVYGGDGRTTFGLPDFRGCIPVHVGSGFVLGQKGGAPTNTLTIAQLPSHTHAFAAANPANTGADTGNLPGKNPSAPFYNGTPNTTMNPAAISNTGGSQPHDNMSPYLVLLFIIALQGIFPSRN